MKGSPPLRAVLRLCLHGDAAGCGNAVEVRRDLPEEYRRALDVVEDTFVRYPIQLLQLVGTRVLPFLYEVDWPEGTSVTTLRREGRDRVRFLDGVGDRLVVLGPLLRPLIELHSARDVARWTGVSTEDDRLRAHLFGTDRIPFPVALRDGLAELQEGGCFCVRAEELSDLANTTRWLSEPARSGALVRSNLTPRGAAHPARGCWEGVRGRRRTDSAIRVI